MIEYKNGTYEEVGGHSDIFGEEEFPEQFDPMEEHYGFGLAISTEDEVIADIEHVINDIYGGEEQS